MDLGAGAAKAPMIREQAARLLDAVIDAIADRFRVVRGDIEPDVEQIFAGAGRENNATHASRFVARRARASVFNAGKSILPASPLSTPSFQAWRSVGEFLGFLLLGLFHEPKRLAHNFARRAVAAGRNLVLDEIRQLLGSDTFMFTSDLRA